VVQRPDRQQCVGGSFRFLPDWMTAMMIQTPDPILDDDGLRRLLKLPEDADLAHYRDRGGLPYLRFRHDGQTVHRYITSEILQWLVRRQQNPLETSDRSYSAEIVPVRLGRQAEVNGSSTHDLQEIHQSLRRVEKTTQSIDRKQEVLACDLIRMAETVECMADDTAAETRYQEALTIRQCAELANVTVTLIKRAIKRGELKAKQVRQRGTGVEYRVLQSDLQQWLSSRETAETIVRAPPTSVRCSRPPLPNYLDR
jgi:excisionase family DNA binding protein